MQEEMRLGEDHPMDDERVGLECMEDTLLVAINPVMEVQDDYDSSFDFILDVPCGNDQRRRSSISEVFETEEFDEMVENLLLSYKDDMTTLQDNDGDDGFLSSHGRFSRGGYDALCEDIMYRDDDDGTSLATAPVVPTSQRRRRSLRILSQKRNQCQGGVPGTEENVRSNAQDETSPVQKDMGTQTVSPMTIERQTNHFIESVSPFRVISPDDALYMIGHKQRVERVGVVEQPGSLAPATQDEGPLQEQIALLEVLFDTIWEHEMPTLKDLRSNGFDLALVNTLVQQSILKRHREYHQRQRFSWARHGEYVS